MPSGVYVRARKNSTQTPEKRFETEKKYKLKDKFGITLDQYKQMLSSQNGVCAICLKAETSTFRGMVKWLAVDHDHESGKIRALLCMNCNQALGKIKEDFDISLRLSKYIQEHKGVI